MTRRVSPPARHGRALLGTLLALSAAFTSGCGGSEPAARGASATAPASDVWAVVDGREIKKDDVERIYRAAILDASAPPSDEESLAARLTIVEDLITQDVLVAKARTAKLEPTETDVDAAFAERRKGLSEQEFAKRMADRNLTPDDIKWGMRREMAAEKLIDQDVVAKVNVSDADVAAYYERNKAQFDLKETQYRLAQIVVTPERDPNVRNRMSNDAATPEQARQKVQMLLEKLRGGTDFASLAMDYSEDPQTLAQGGDLGFIPASALQQSSPMLREVVTKTQPGNVTTATAGNALMLVMVVSREDPGQRTLETPNVRENIRNMLKQTRTQILRDAYIAAARDDADIVNHLARQVVSAQGAPPPGLIAPAAR
jgi:peptidyl-prolyl cis-trans isomerase SurA